MKQGLDKVCGLLAAAALFAIMALTFADVLGRKLFDASLPGSLELTELLMVAVIFAALPLVSLHGDHVVFDTLDSRLPAALRRVQRPIVDALCMMLLLGLGWLMWQKAGKLSAYGDITAQLRLPVGPVVYAMSVLCFVSGAVHGALMLRPGAAAEGGA